MDKRWMAVVTGALLVGTLIGGVIWARPGQDAQAAGGTHRITVPAAFFHPMSPGYNYWNNGNELWVNSGNGYFTAPVVFPCLASVTVERIIFSVKDQNGGANACVSLDRTKPNKGTDTQMAYQCSGGSQPGVINYTDDTINGPVVWPSNGPYLWLYLPGPSIGVYGVRIEYQINN